MLHDFLCHSWPRICSIRLLVGIVVACLSEEGSAKGMWVRSPYKLFLISILAGRQALVGHTAHILRMTMPISIRRFTIVHSITPSGSDLWRVAARLHSCQTMERERSFSTILVSIRTTFCCIDKEVRVSVSLAPVVVCSCCYTHFGQQKFISSCSTVPLAFDLRQASTRMHSYVAENRSRPGHCPTG